MTNLKNELRLIAVREHEEQELLRNAPRLKLSELRVINPEDGDYDYGAYSPWTNHCDCELEEDSDLSGWTE